MKDFGLGLPGYQAVELPISAEFAETDSWSASEWQAEFEKTRNNLQTFIEVRDPYVVLARSAFSFILTSENPTEEHVVEQAEVEITQTLLLLHGRNDSGIPTAPKNFERFWRLQRRHIHAFMRKQTAREGQSLAEQYVSQRARAQTLYYRNHFSREDCEEVLIRILAMLDVPSQMSLGYKLSDLFRAAARLFDLIQQRYQIFRMRLHRLLNTTERAELVECIDFFCLSYPAAKRAWRNRTDRFADIESLRAAAYQMSELAHPWVYTLSRKTLDSEFSPPIVEALLQLAIAPGSLQGIDPEHIYLSNPIWERPYILTSDGLFVALPHLIFSFPFRIVESLIRGHTDLEVRYEVARAQYLETEISTLISESIPSADVYQSVVWNDPDTNQTWENDVVAVVGNFIFILEAKSGRISEAARRGGPLSLRKIFSKLFVEPGEQSGRLERYLRTKKRSAELRLKETNEPIDLGLEKPKVVFALSVCIEHFAALTSARHHLKELGLISDTTPWAPVLSLGELKMVFRFLDSEVSAIHYLTRRATLEQMLDFEADEQDILSTYLTNGLCLDGEKLKGQRVMFIQSDAEVRRDKIASPNKTDVRIYGIPLSPLWKRIVEELYQDNTNRHRFDLINVILNQVPPALAEFERRIKRFRRNAISANDEMEYLKFPFGEKLHVLAIHLARITLDEHDWQNLGRELAFDLIPEVGSIECATFLFCRRSKNFTFDAASFYRLIREPYVIADS